MAADGIADHAASTTRAVHLSWESSATAAAPRTIARGLRRFEEVSVLQHTLEDTMLLTLNKRVITVHATCVFCKPM